MASFVGYCIYENGNSFDHHNYSTHSGEFGEN